MFPGDKQPRSGLMVPLGVLPHPALYTLACSFAEWETDLNLGTPRSDNLFLSEGRDAHFTALVWR